jgi:thymidine phosphorylase
LLTLHTDTPEAFPGALAAASAAFDIGAAEEKSATALILDRIAR